MGRFPGATGLLENTAVPGVFRGTQFLMRPDENVTITGMEGKYFGKEVTLVGNGTRRIAQNGEIRLKSADGAGDGRTPARGALVRFVYTGSHWQEL